MGDEFEHRSTAELLTLHAAIMEELAAGLFGARTTPLATT